MKYNIFSKILAFYLVLKHQLKFLNIDKFIFTFSDFNKLLIVFRIVFKMNYHLLHQELALNWILLNFI